MLPHSVSHPNRRVGLLWGAMEACPKPRTSSTQQRERNALHGTAFSLKMPFYTHPHLTTFTVLPPPLFCYSTPSASPSETSPPYPSPPDFFISPDIIIPSLSAWTTHFTLYPPGLTPYLPFQPSLPSSLPSHISLFSVPPHPHSTPIPPPLPTPPSSFPSFGRLFPSIYHYPSRLTQKSPLSPFLTPPSSIRSILPLPYTPISGSSKSSLLALSPLLASSFLRPMGFDSISRSRGLGMLFFFPGWSLPPTSRIRARYPICLKLFSKLDDQGHKISSPHPDFPWS